MPDVMNGMCTLLHITGSVYESWIFLFLVFLVLFGVSCRLSSAKFALSH